MCDRLLLGSPDCALTLFRLLCQLYDLLNKCNEGLLKFSHVNKKALDQYINFSQQRQTLLDRKKDLDAGDEVCSCVR